MRIALSYPWCWPWVERGGERLFADLSRYLAGAGHEVLAISAAPRPSRHRDAFGVEWIERRAITGRRFPGRDVDQAVTSQLTTALTLRQERPDVTHGLHHLDGVAARLAHRRPYVVHAQGMASRAVLERRRVHHALFPVSVAKAGAVVAVSRAAAGALNEQFGINARTLYNGVYTADLAAGREAARRADRPTVLFPGDGADPRKRLPVLADALALLSPEWPGLRLRVPQGVDARGAGELAARAGVDVDAAPAGGPGAMPAVYAEAWVTCLPAVREAFGLVFVESLAAGTPAVGVADGGVPEIITDPDWLARPDDAADLARVLSGALAAADGGGAVVARCQAMAAPFDWSVTGPPFEALYRELLSR